MAKLRVLVEIVPTVEQAALAMASSASIRPASSADLFALAEAMMAGLPGTGIEVTDAFGPIPLAAADASLEAASGEPALASASSTSSRRRRGGPKAASPPLTNVASVVLPCEVTTAGLHELESRSDVVVWPDSRLSLTQGSAPDEGLVGLLDLATSAGGTDCRPFRPGVSVEAIRTLLGVEALWRDGFRGQNVIVGILDEGVSNLYPVVGGHQTTTERRWGLAAITSHGSMCAADILVAAPAARLYDYPFLGQPSSGGAIAMFQAVLDQHRRDGTPHLTNNSYGFVSVPPRETMPNHEIWNLNHPVHRKAREVVAAGIPCFFAAGNCGENCPSGACHPSGIGPGLSIHASNSLAEVITVAAVNSRHERVGYSSQGPGMFERAKPDVAAYTHLFGNFGPGRPGGLAQPYDNGTSAATPVACGVGAALLSAFADLSPAALKAALMQSALDIGQPGRDFLTGSGVVNAAAAYQLLRGEGRMPGRVRPRLPDDRVA
ncbi:S8 family peptidase [Methylobacterium oryzisoli]|uniref:S8 family peptidase n=1 Tax=Methylobacterium oryzisoli TaxID=3385502 RepID=UPI0038919E37